jgi:hypothetical protein
MIRVPQREARVAQQRRRVQVAHGAAPLALAKPRRPRQHRVIALLSPTGGPCRFGAAT